MEENPDPLTFGEADNHYGHWVVDEQHSHHKANVPVDDELGKANKALVKVFRKEYGRDVKRE